MFIKFCCKVIVTWIFIICLKVCRFYDFISRYFHSTEVKLYIRYFLYIRNFARNFSRSSCRSYFLDGKFFINSFRRVENVLRIPRIIYLLSSVYKSDIVWFCRFCISITLKKSFTLFLPSSSHLMLVQSLGPFASFFTN